MNDKNPNDCMCSYHAIKEICNYSCRSVHSNIYYYDNLLIILLCQSDFFSNMDLFLFEFFKKAFYWLF